MGPELVKHDFSMVVPRIPGVPKQVILGHFELILTHVNPCMLPKGPEKGHLEPEKGSKKGETRVFPTVFRERLGCSNKRFGAVSSYFAHFSLAQMSKQPRSLGQVLPSPADSNLCRVHVLGWGVKEMHHSLLQCRQELLTQLLLLSHSCQGDPSPPPSEVFIFSRNLSLEGDDPTRNNSLSGYQSDLQAQLSGLRKDGSQYSSFGSPLHFRSSSLARTDSDAVQSGTPLPHYNGLQRPPSPLRLRQPPPAPSTRFSNDVPPSNSPLQPWPQHQSPLRTFNDTARKFS